MKNISLILLSFVFVILLSCNKENINVNQPAGNNNASDLCTDSNCDHPEGNIFYQDGIRWLWGGENDEWHFNISSLDIDANNLKSGLGREFFKALIEPEYGTMVSMSHLFEDDDEFIIVYAEEGIKAYSIDLMTTHEVINDVIDGQPVMVCYCVLADFPGVYSRNHCGETFTFALSGYIYSEEGVWFGRDGFVLWDRDTESLWWPLKGEAVSGGMNGTRLNTNLSFEWDRVNWEYIKSNYTDLKILAYGQDMEIPLRWDQIDTDDLDCN